jgi:NosR/NirI family transcriptional regulator, nitrous oxide reductase regulator
MRLVLTRPVLLRVYRAGLLLILALLVHFQTQWRETRHDPALSIRQAREFFPAATRLKLRDPERGLHYVFDARGETLGVLLTTSPHTDDIVGYSGPNNVLIALGTDGAIAGVQLLKSGDTEDHAAKVARDTNFFDAFRGWNPDGPARLRVEGVSGATLTSYAIAEAVQERLAGGAPSLRFPEPITLEEVRGVFTNSAAIVIEDRRVRVLDARQRLLGYALRTSPQADNVGGYRGPTEALVGLAPDGRTVIAVRIRGSYDTDSYVDQIRSDDHFLRLFQGRTLEELALLDFKKEKIEGVSGATQTSYALAEGLKRRAAAALQPAPAPDRRRPQGRDYGLAAVVIGSLIMSFTSLRGRRWFRTGWQLLLVGYVGLANADLLSLALLGGWTTSAPAWRAAPGLVLLAAAALIVPLLSGRQIYCHQLCPHGAAQQLLGRILRRRWAVPARLGAALEHLPAILLLLALLILVAGWRFDLADLEAFDAWSWRAAAGATVAIALLGLAAALFIPQAYCRYGCPTGALLRFVRSSGSGDHWGRRDWGALGLLAIALLAAAFSRAFPPQPVEPEPALFTGRTMGTTWSVKIRDEIADPALIGKAISNQFEWCEQMTSHWRTNTALARFNRAPTTEAVGVPWPMVTLARRSAEFSRATDGAFDITVGPLVRLWGFGPPPRRTTPPTEAEIAELLPAIGWQQLEVLDGELRKKHPALEIDLSAIAPGWAIDEVAGLLEFRGYTNFLVESGGELRARGAWPIVIEHPARKIVLRDESIGTSGTYRHNYSDGAREYSHLIDPRTGRPVTHNTVSVSVRGADCARADAWAAGLNVLGVEEGLPLAERLGLAAQFVVRKPNGALQLHQTTKWNAAFTPL